MSVVRITSPTPSIEEEIEEERRLLQEQKLQQELESGTGSSDSGSLDSPESSNAAPSSSAASTKNESTTTAAAAAGPSGVSTRRSNKSSAAQKEAVMLDDEETPHVSMMVEGFYPPSEAKKFAEEVLTLAGLRKPLHVETRIDYEFHRYVVANDHCYTPLTSPSQKLPPRPYYEDLDSPIEIRASDDTLSTDVQQVQPAAEVTSGTSRKRPTPSKAIASSSTTSGTRRRKSFSKGEISNAEDLQSILEDSDSDYSAESSFPEEDDNDSDLDFSITGRTPKKRKSVSHSKHPKSASKKDDSLDPGKKKTVKSPKKFEPKTPTSMLNKTGVPRTYGSKRNLQQHLSAPAPPVSTNVIPAVVSAPVHPTTITIIKKDHKKPVVKPTHHSQKLISDMTSLFSTPDIIKKVGPAGAGRPASHAMTATTTPVVTPSTSNTIRVVTPNTSDLRIVTPHTSNTVRLLTSTTTNTIRGFVQLSPATIRGAQKLPAHISIQTHTSASEEHDKRLDLIDSIVQQELNHPDPKLPPLQQQQPAQPTMTEDIVKMLENNLPPGGVQESVLPITDNSILAALGSNDDGLPEDLLQHVAELAEHKELQEILDKQVLGVIGSDPPITTPAAPPLPVPSTSAMIPIPVSQQTPIPTSTPSNPSTLNPESLPTMTVKEQLMPRKEAIQIRRSDGRVITLPPIEAPATRSAKRRAQAGTSSSASATSLSSASHTTVAPSPGSSAQSPASHHAASKSSKQSTKASASAAAAAGITSYDDGSGSLMIDESRAKGGSRSGTSSRRTSESSSTSGRGKRQSTVAVAAAVAAAAAEDDAESDSSWNSEDDPDR